MLRHLDGFIASACAQVEIKSLLLFGFAFAFNARAPHPHQYTAAQSLCAVTCGPFSQRGPSLWPKENSSSGSSAAYLRLAAGPGASGSIVAAHASWKLLHLWRVGELQNHTGSAGGCFSESSAPSSLSAGSAHHGFAVGHGASFDFGSRSAACKQSWRLQARACRPKSLRFAPSPLRVSALIQSSQFDNTLLGQPAAAPSFHLLPIRLWLSLGAHLHTPTVGPHSILFLLKELAIAVAEAKMLHSFPPSVHPDPFHCSSSSPDRLVLASYVATRPNPYTVKSQNTQYYTSLRSTAQSSSLSPRRASPGVANAITTSSAQVDSIDRAHSSLQAAARTPRCYSKPHGFSHSLYPQLTMVKSKKRPVKGLVVREEQTVAKRTSTIKLSPAAVNKRNGHVAEAAKHRARTADAAVQSSPSLDPMLLETEPLRPEIGSPLSSPSPSPATQSRTRAAARMQVPRITIRSPTPELDPEHQRLLGAESSGSAATNVEAPEMPLYSKSLLVGLQADMGRVEDDIDAILSKYLEPRQSVRSISIEFLRSLTSSVCRLHSYVEEAHSALGFAKLRAISSHLFRHAVTGFIHLLEDPIAPYETAANLALVSAKIVHDFDKATELCCRLLGVPSQGKEKINHGKLFANVLMGELDIVLEKGEAMVDGDNKLALPGTGALVFDAPSCDKDGQEACSFAGGSAWKGRASLRKQWAQEGEERNQFAAMDVVRFVGELGVQEVATVGVVARWLDRFLTRTAYIDIPSAWEIECACALLITVGATLDRRAYPNARSRSSGEREESNALQLQDAVASSPTTEDTVQGDPAAIETMQRTMHRIDFLVTHAEISPAAREWLIEVERLRKRGWRRDDDVHLPDMSLFSN